MFFCQSIFLAPKFALVLLCAMCGKIISCIVPGSVILMLLYIQGKQKKLLNFWFEQGSLAQVFDSFITTCFG